MPEWIIQRLVVQPGNSRPYKIGSAARSRRDGCKEDAQAALILTSLSVERTPMIIDLTHGEGVFWLCSVDNPRPARKGALCPTKRPAPNHRYVWSIAGVWLQA